MQMKKAIGWFIAILITFSVAIFQFIMGESYPLVTEANTGKQLLQFELKRSCTGETDCPIVLPIGDITVSGYVLYRIYPSDIKMSRIVFNREGDKLIAHLPVQPPAGKLEYRIFLERSGAIIDINQGKPVIIRFFGNVPLSVMIVYSLLIFLAILYSTLTGIFAGLGIKNYKWKMYFTVAALVGFVFLFQPLMHNYTLNQWWIGAPFNWELENNKILIVLIIWIFTAFYNFKKSRPGLVVIASFLSILLFSIPPGFPAMVHEPVTPKIVLRNLLLLLQLF